MDIGVIILAIIQGIAEFLPISSSAHLIIFRDLFEIGNNVVTLYETTMEKAGHYYGYMLYRTKVKRDSFKEKYRIINGRDRAQSF